MLLNSRNHINISEPAKDPISAKQNPSIQPVTKIKWRVDKRIIDSLSKAQSFIDKTVGDSDLEVHHFTEYGGNLIKKVGKVSPDAFIQMCIQLTFYRLHGYCTGIYETASTRKYLHGRTEVCRSFSAQQKLFCESFDDKRFSPQDKYKMFHEACKAHVNYLAVASDGMGCDRHLLGLRFCLKEGENHAIFQSAAYSKSSKWQLSTSGLFPSEYLKGTGFGSVVSKDLI
jgi:carnitine O-acetyltransferase